MELKLIDQSGKSTANVAAADDVFGRDYNEAYATGQNFVNLSLLSGAK